jgi:transposase
MPRQRKTKVQSLQPSINPHAAGADIGAREIYVAVPTALTAEPVRCFPTFTENLRELVAWLQSFGIKTVAMEATSVYWIPLAELLEEAKIEVCLVNPRHVKNVPGRKTDVMDCQWLQYLHSVGLLRAAFRPAAAVRGVRALWRQRDALVSHSSWHIQHMHKALDQMNLQVHHVLADITGQTGTAMVAAILRGERDPVVLARHRDPRVKASEATLVKALTGDYRAEHLFCLKQAFAGYQFVSQQIAEVDAELKRRLEELTPAKPRSPETAAGQPAAEAAAATPPQAQATAPAKKKKPKGKFAPKFDARSLLEQLFGVDLCTVPAIQAVTAQTMWGELGGDLSAFPTAKHFTSWLGLCCDNRISGGKLLGTHTRPTANRVARALRMAAQSLHHAKNELGDYYRRMRAKLGGAAAITATAHKLARIIYAMVTTKQSYRADLHDSAAERHRARTLARLTAKAKDLGFQLVPTPAVA